MSTLFWGAAAGGSLINLTGKGPTAINTFPDVATASLALRSDGQHSTYVTTLGGSSTVFYDGEWMNPAGVVASSDYEAYATGEVTLGTGTLFGTYDSWLNLGTTRTWGLDGSTDGNTTDAVVTVQIRRVGEESVLASAVFNLNAESPP